tara:strand:+ start:450 stop:1400 length:951 start_codon:yes stop_codon:yes gene_type:complete
MNNKYILFWSSYDKRIDNDHNKWSSRKINISPFHHLSLASHIKLNNDTTLYSYQEFNKGQIPKGIKVKNANEIFPSKQAFSSLVNGHSIAHISDAVRLKVASEILGVVLDMDAVILRKPPEDDGWFASMPSKLTGGFAPKWGKAHPPLYINDKSWDGKALFNFPLKVSKNISKYIASLSHKIMKTLMEDPKTDSKAWNYVIWTVKKLIIHDKNAKVYEPLYFHPLPAWLGKGKCYSLESPTRLDGKTELFGHTLPDINEIFKKSFIVHHFFESAFNKSSGVDSDFWETLKDDCLLAKEAEHIFGKDWRSILYDKSY